MNGILKSLLVEIDKCYLHADKELLERPKLEEVEVKIITELENVITNLDDELLSLQFKKFKNQPRHQLRSGFHNIQTAHSRLEFWRIFINEILQHIKSSTKTFKNRLEVEGLFIESRSKKGEDMHLIIGERDGRPEKAHAIIDDKTGEIRVEDNQAEPLQLVRKIEAIITLDTGKKIKVTRESIEEIIEE